MRKVNTLIIGSGAAGLAAALRLNGEGVKDILLLSEGLSRGTSINTGSDKQTYYKLGIYGKEPDAPGLLAQTLFDGGSVHGDIALIEATLSLRCFMNLANLGVPFPTDEFGQYIGYKTDHDPKRRATSCGPYTSKEMCLALIKAVKAAGVEIWENRTAGELVCCDDRVCGVVALNSDTGALESILAENVIFATGGPGGLYAQSVYPCGHSGAIGLALEKGCSAQNLPESQFGMASIKFRWNVSGTYMQVLPRFISTAPDGSDPKEFLRDHFGDDIGKMNSMVFLKGYQWPFDVRKAENGSSVIDLLVHHETAVRKRRVFLDYRSNPEGLDFSALSPEAYTYLERSGALFGTPLERLEKMNPGAISLYADHHIDLHSEMLEIAVCAQHNNGGLTGNIWYESPTLKSLFPIGEVNGSHGVTRPGGSALNAGQVGAFRAAEFIAHCRKENSFDMEKAERAAVQVKKHLEKFLSGSRDVHADRREFQERMTLYAGHLREHSSVMEALDAAKALFFAVEQGGYPAKFGAQALMNRQLAFAHWGYLSAIAFQISSGTGSRGSAAVLDENGNITPENESFRKQILETRFVNGDFHHRWVPCRPLPETDGWFENIWADYRNGNVYKTSAGDK
ncbi:MAG: FAD-binding protein [Lentisphaeria bacterium]|nr:FAD-binding protein [Lentisphaeria bacterium]